MDKNKGFFDIMAMRRRSTSGDHACLCDKTDPQYLFRIKESCMCHPRLRDAKRSYSPDFVLLDCAVGCRPESRNCSSGVRYPATGSDDEVSNHFGTLTNTQPGVEPPFTL